MKIPLARVGQYGRRLHAIDAKDPDGRVICETRAPSGHRHRTQDGNGTYRDLSKPTWSTIHAAGRGTPTCPDCLRYLGKP